MVILPNWLPGAVVVVGFLLLGTAIAIFDKRH